MGVSVGTWLQSKVNLSVKAWEVIGSKPTTGMSNIAVVPKKEMLMVFLPDKELLIHSPSNKILLWI